MTFSQLPVVVSRLRAIVVSPILQNFRDSAKNFWTSQGVLAYYEIAPQMATSIFLGEMRMLETLNGQAMLFALSVVLLIVLMTVGYLLIKFIRGATIKDDINAADLAQNFEEMRREGDISESEFRTIQAVIGKSQSSNPNGTGTAQPG